MDKQERITKSQVFAKIKRVREDALEAKNWAEKEGGKDYYFWDGYLEGVDYIMFILEDIKYKKNQPKKQKAK